MNWISWFGLGIVLLLLIPNAVYAAANKNTQPPVSYTHLDVYKRQLQESTHDSSA